MKNSKTFKWLIALVIFAFGMELLIRFLDDTPTIVTEVFKDLNVNPEIKSRIGDLNGFSFNKFEIAKTDKLPSKIRMTLFGEKYNADLTVLVDSSDQVFEVIEFQVDSLYEN